MSTPIHQEIVFDASPQRVYQALTNATEFSKMCGGAPAEIDAVTGGSFSCFGGMISGIVIDLVPNQRIVQAWHVGNWPEGDYSIVKVQLKPEGQKTRLILDHDGFPEDNREHLDGGWNTNYWEPLSKYLA